MDTEFLDKIVLGAPNFVGLVLALVILYRRLREQDRLVQTLISKWERCEDDRERRDAKPAS